MTEWEILSLKRFGIPMYWFDPGRHGLDRNGKGQTSKNTGYLVGDAVAPRVLFLS